MATERSDSLRGGCSCGRNHYLILIPSGPITSLQILYDDMVDHSRGLSLRVPLTTIQSTTQAFYPDETHSSIRRVFTPPHAPHTKRHFCGFCGTPLTYWSEETSHEADFVRVNVGSLKSESLDTLQEAGLLDMSETPEVEAAAVRQRGEHAGQIEPQGTSREVRGNPWFEEMIEGSELGRIRRRRGGRTSTDGSGTMTYEWEVVEVGGGEEDTHGRGAIGKGEKRKLRDVGDEVGDKSEGEDHEMRG